MDISVYTNGARWHLEQAEKDLDNGFYADAQEHVREANRLLGEAHKHLDKEPQTRVVFSIC